VMDSNESNARTLERRMVGGVRGGRTARRYRSVPERAIPKVAGLS
jgi:hypothetical protein